MKKSTATKPSDIVLELVHVDPTLSVHSIQGNGNVNAKELPPKQSKEPLSMYGTNVGQSLNVDLATSNSESKVGIDENTSLMGYSGTTAVKELTCLTENPPDNKADEGGALIQKSGNNSEESMALIGNEPLPLEIYSLEGLNMERISSFKGCQEISTDLFPATSQLKTFKEMLEQVQPRTQSSALPIASAIKMASTAVGRMPTPDKTSVHKGQGGKPLFNVPTSLSNQTDVKLIPQKVPKISPSARGVRLSTATYKKPEVKVISQIPKKGSTVMGNLPASTTTSAEMINIVPLQSLTPVPGKVVPPTQVSKQIVITPRGSGQKPTVSVSQTSGKLLNQTSVSKAVQTPKTSCKTNGPKATPRGVSQRMPSVTTVSNSSAIKNVNVYDSAGNLIRRIVSKNVNPSSSMSSIMCKSTMSS